jgi:alkyl hydroperoxide reductase subunit AhpC
MAVALTPEPEGGEELQAISTVAETRMKNMGEADGVTSDEGTVYQFWLSTIADGEMIKQIRTQVLKDASKNVCSSDRIKFQSLSVANDVLLLSLLLFTSASAG